MRGVLFRVCEGHWEEQSSKWVSSSSAVSTLAASVAANCSGAKRDAFLGAINTPALLGSCRGSSSFYRHQQITAAGETLGRKKINCLGYNGALAAFLIFCKCKCASVPAFKTKWLYNGKKHLFYANLEDLISIISVTRKGVCYTICLACFVLFSSKTCLGGMGSIWYSFSSFPFSFLLSSILPFFFL